jgi:hypothetical protein
MNQMLKKPKLQKRTDNVIVGILGLKGGGKTVVMTVLVAYEQMMLKKKVYSNLWFSFPHKIIDAKRMVELDVQLKNSVIAIDEIHTIADSRRSGALQNLLLSYFITQSRHRSVNMYWTDQFENQVDKRIRQNTDIKIIVENLHFDSDGDGIDDLFRLIIIDKREIPPLIYETYWCVTDFFTMFDTDYLIDIFKYKKGDKLVKKKKD